MFQRFSNFVLPYRKLSKLKNRPKHSFSSYTTHNKIFKSQESSGERKTLSTWNLGNAWIGWKEMYFPFARKMVTKQVRCKILGILCWRTVERPRNASEKEWSRQPQSCLSAVGLTGLGSQSKKRPCSVAMSTRCVCARVSLPLFVIVVRTRDSSFLPLPVHSRRTRDYIVIARVRSWNALDRGRLILLDKFGAIRWGYGRGILEGLEVLEDIVCVCFFLSRY